MKRGQIIYLQGIWKCRVVNDLGNSVQYIALAGVPENQKLNVWTADKHLFKRTQNQRKNK